MTSNDSFSLAVQMVKQLDIYAALPRYGVEMKSNAAPCPFHEDSTPSFGVYNGARGQRLHCLGCGWDGDLIQFVSELYGLSFRDAVSQICTDFHLPAPDELRPEDRARIRHIQRRADARKAAIDRADEIRRAWESLWWIADDILQSIPPADRNKGNDFYVDAVFRRMDAERNLSRAEIRLYNLTH